MLHRLTRSSLAIRAGLLATAFLTACVTRGAYDAKVVDGLTGEPRGELRVMLKAVSTDDLTCKVFDGTTDAEGLVHIDGTCADTAYTVSLGDSSLLLVGGAKVEGGVESTSVAEVQAWRAPRSPGVYILANDEAKNVRTRTRLMREERVVGTETVALYPESVFKNPSPIQQGQHLVLRGQAIIAKTKIMPIIAEPEKRTFESGSSLAGHAFVGLRFSADDAVEQVAAQLDESKLIEAGEGAATTRYIPADALPPGQYAIYKEGDREALVVTFGPPAAAK